MINREEQHLQAIEAVLNQIEEQLRQPIAVDALARLSGMSLWHFQRIFAALTGEPVGSYVRRRRLTSAARELLATKVRILDLALDYQFESHSAFTRAFRDVFGLSPNQFRRKRMSPLAARPRLTAERLRHLQRVRLQPEIVTIPSLTLDGLTTRFLSVASESTNAPTVLPQSWRKFRACLRTINSPADRVTYGAWKGLEPDEQCDPDELVYLAATLSSAESPVQEGFVRWSAPRLRYAKFVHRGPIARIGTTISFIYAVWLPNSRLERADSFDLERYDARFEAHSETSELDYFVPLKD